MTKPLSMAEKKRQAREHNEALRRAASIRKDGSATNPKAAKRRAAHATARVDIARDIAAEALAETQRLAEENQNLQQILQERDGSVPHSRLEYGFEAAAGQPTGRPESKKKLSARANLYQAFEDMGGVPALVEWGKKNASEFYKIWARLLPTEVEDETKTLPLESLLEKLSQRADMSVEEAARQIGQEALDAARDEVSIEDAIGAYRGTLQ